MCSTLYAMEKSLKPLTCLPAFPLVGSVKPLKENLKEEVEDMKTVKKIKQVLEYIFLAISTYFTICVLCAG